MSPSEAVLIGALVIGLLVGGIVLGDDISGTDAPQQHNASTITEAAGSPLEGWTFGEVTPTPTPVPVVTIDYNDPKWKRGCIILR